MMASIIRSSSPKMRSRASITLHVSLFIWSAVLGRDDLETAADSCKFDNATYKSTDLLLDAFFAADYSVDDEDPAA